MQDNLGCKDEKEQHYEFYKTGKFYSDRKAD